ncbi:hypothetical protein XI09_31685 [Bradyrhizobium sp. CCBAU 11386]|uniref:hypothetical protein n=1 Tax=Bradyrhizobium sp. CCBAU 11386 TaxID=1630837 RepID=UPI003FA4C55B|nr:hypothetical protein [Bradyrhizobium sp. CCBAU 11386]
MLRRIPAVKWAFTRLRPLPQGGSIDVSPIATDDSPAIAVDVAEAAPTPDISIKTDVNDPGITVAAPVAEDDTAISVIAESPPAAQTETGVSDDSSPESSTEPVVVEEASVSPVDVETASVDVADLTVSRGSPAELPTHVESVGTEEASVQPVVVDSAPVDIPELAVSGSPTRELPTDVEPVVTEETPVSSVDGETAPVATLDLIVSHEPSSDVLVDIEPAIVDDPHIALADIEVSPADIPAVSVDSGSSADVAVEIEPVPSDPAPVIAVATEDASADTSGEVADIAPEPILASPALEIRSTPKVRARATDPADRTALIRQRWAETGIRMWNPRLHGTGDATLNIQGRVELLPPAPGETMPRYDKLEFRMLGGQIVCEGVIVEAPAQASHRSFTRLAEPGKPDRVREPVRERQAALA